MQSIFKSGRTKKLNVFHGLVNYGTQAGLFAKELRKQGIDAISVSYPDPFKRQIDIELLHGGNLIEKIIKHAWNWIRRFYWFFRYNTFHFYYGTTLFPKQLDLPLYNFFGKKVVMHYLGGDVDTYPTCRDVDYYGRKIDNRKKIKRLTFESKYVLKQFVCAPWYLQFVKGAILMPLAIDLEKYRFHPMEIKDEIVIMHSPTNRIFKKSDYIESAVQRLIIEDYPIKYKCIMNVSHNKLIEEYITSHLIIDQLNFGYGTVAIEAMALGRAVISGLDRDSHINAGLWEQVPIIRADISNIYQVLKDTIINSQHLPSIGLKSRLFVEQYHDVRILTKKLIDYYSSI